MLRNTPALKAPSQKPVSVAATRIVEAAIREDCSIAELGKLAQSDPGFAMRVLSLVNSAAFGLSRQVGDVRQAVGLLGARGLRNLALSLVISDMVPTGEGGRILLANCLRRALAAQGISEALGERRTDGYFTAGLFLESGLLARARHHADGAADIAKSPAAHRVVREMAAGEDPHPIVGARLANEFHLPRDIASAIAHHHDDAMPEGAIPGAAWVAEHIAAVFEGGNVASILKEAVAAGAELGVTEAQVDALIRALPQKVVDVAKAFERDVGEQPDLETLAVEVNRSLVELNGQYAEVVQTLERVIAEKDDLERQLRAANVQLAHKAMTDALTGLPNKYALTDALSRDLARADRGGEHVSLIVVDIDHFKRVNDTWGHATGDEVLRGVGGVIRESVRASDVPARYGGEEFVVVLPNTDLEGAAVVAERIRERLEMHRMPGPAGTLQVTASLGVAAVQGPDCRESERVLFERADAALYEAKRSGRNRVRVALPGVALPEADS